MIRGERISLRPFRREDLPALRRWFDDGEVMQYWGNSSPLVPEHMFEDDLAPGGRFTKFGAEGYFCLCDETGRPIGWLSYNGLHHRHCAPELGILIGEKDAWNKGYGPEAIVLLLGWLFTHRGAHRVWLTVQARNGRAQRAYEKVGFVREGTWREHYFYDGAFGGQGLGAFRDMEQLTAFADYKVPQVLRRLGILLYDDHLSGLVDSRTELASGSPEEVEIRAATIWGVEELRRAMTDLGRPVRAFEVDWYLWEEGQSIPDERPYHRTRTIYY